MCREIRMPNFDPRMHSPQRMNNQFYVTTTLGHPTQINICCKQSFGAKIASTNKTLSTASNVLTWFYNFTLLTLLNEKPLKDTKVKVSTEKRHQNIEPRPSLTQFDFI